MMNQHESDETVVKAELASLTTDELEAVKGLERNLGDKYYLIAYHR
jgi:hypothetical protein